MTFKRWLETEAGQRALEYAEQAPGAGLGMAWDAALYAAVEEIQKLKPTDGAILASLTVLGVTV